MVKRKNSSNLIIEMKWLSKITNANCNLKV